MLRIRDSVKNNIKFEAFILIEEDRKFPINVMVNNKAGYRFRVMWDWKGEWVVFHRLVRKAFLRR